MQRLFSTFAEGPPGAGLLIQRLLVGGALLYCAVAAPGESLEAPQVITGLSGLLLIAGLWTPLAGVVAGCTEVWIALARPYLELRDIGRVGRNPGADRTRRVVH